MPEQREEAGAGSSLTAANRPVATAAAQAAIPPSLQGDKVRFATVLFADLVGSTRLIAALDPEDARDTLDRALAIVTDAVRRFGGMVARVQGDGVMAVFGVRPAIEDHALRAGLAGL
ncbi:MAG TPA: adenylate/guanylate cyclase domain-containing protein, partial [Novosphingobium sp.]|nr:adenylate/guanylate cyclase domain-containing protein [Novosphingobium sp.]